MNKIVFSVLFLAITALLCIAIEDMTYAIIIGIAMGLLYVLLYNKYYKKQTKTNDTNSTKLKDASISDKKKVSYKDVIKEARMPYILSCVNHENYEKILKDKYIDICKETINPEDENSTYHAGFTIEDKVTNLENVYNDLLLAKGLNKKVLPALERVIDYGKNKVKYREIIENGELYTTAYYDGVINCEHIFRCKLSSKVLGKPHYKIIAYKDKIFFFRSDTYELDDTFTILADELSYIERFKYEEKKEEYKPTYAKVRKPINKALTCNIPELRIRYEAEYKRDLEKYNAEIVQAEIHNMEEERKYQESIGKTTASPSLTFTYKQPKDNSVLGLTLVSIINIPPKGFEKVDYILTK